MRIRTELTGENMDTIYGQYCKGSVPLGGDASWASVIVHDETHAIIPWSIIFSCFLTGTYFVETSLGDIELPMGITLTNCKLRLAIMPAFSDTRYNRWRLFNVENSCEI